MIAVYVVPRRKYDAAFSPHGFAFVAALASFAAMLVLANSASAASAPSIGNEFALHITEHDATLEAYIYPGGLETTYKFRLESGCLPPSSCSEITTYPLPSSEIPASAGSPDQVVLDLNSAGVTLSPYTEYRYNVEATNSAGTAEGVDRRFTTAPASTASVESESVSHITSTDATLEAVINPKGLETTYEVSVETVSCMLMMPQEEGELDRCEATPQGLIVGSLPAGFSGQPVSIDIASVWHSLTPSTWYMFYVSVRNMDGISGRGSPQFKTSAPPTPRIESVSQITSTSATLEATIDPGSATPGAYYQFQLVENSGEFATEIQCPPPPSSGPFLPCVGTESASALPIGQIAHAAGETTVTLDLAEAGVVLKPGTTYHYRVLVAPAKQSEDTIEWEGPSLVGDTQSFTTPSTVSPVPPSIESESAAKITSTDATLEAQINPGDAPDGVYYQFQIASDLGEYVTEIVCPPEPSSSPAHPCIGAHSSDALPIGFVAAGSGPSSVSLDLASAGVALQPGTSYQYRVLVAKAIQSEDTIEWEEPTVAGADQTFMTATCPITPGTEPQSGGGSQPGFEPPPPLAHHRHHHHRRHKKSKRNFHRQYVAAASVVA